MKEIPASILHIAEFDIWLRSDLSFDIQPPHYIIERMVKDLQDVKGKKKKESQESITKYQRLV
eukprot:3804791-Ditylum_brightwellii.AAC.1